MSDAGGVITTLGVETGLTVWLIVKAALVIGLLIYTGFAVMIVRQVELMSRALNGTFKKPLKSVAWGYFVATVVTLMAILVLL